MSCRNLYLTYKKACEGVDVFSQCPFVDMASMNIDELKSYISSITAKYASAKNCRDRRLNHYNKCIMEEMDDGHALQLELLNNQMIKCEKRIAGAMKRLAVEESKIILEEPPKSFRGEPRRKSSEPVIKRKKRVSPPPKRPKNKGSNDDDLDSLFESLSVENKKLQDKREKLLARVDKELISLFEWYMRQPLQQYTDIINAELNSMVTFYLRDYGRYINKQNFVLEDLVNDLHEVPNPGLELLLDNIKQLYNPYTRYTSYIATARSIPGLDLSQLSQEKMNIVDDIMDVLDFPEYISDSDMKIAIDKVNDIFEKLIGYRILNDTSPAPLYTLFMFNNETLITILRDLDSGAQ